MTTSHPPITQSAENENQLISAFPRSNLSLNGSLLISDYISEQPVSPETAGEMKHWIERKDAATRSKIVVYQAKFLGCSLAATCFLFGLAAFYPKADKAMIKDLLPLIINPQVTLLGVSLGYYFGAKGK
jgi:hypothetical protein